MGPVVKPRVGISEAPRLKVCARRAFEASGEEGGICVSLLVLRIVIPHAILVLLLFVFVGKVEFCEMSEASRKRGRLLVIVVCVY